MRADPYIRAMKTALLIAAACLLALFSTTDFSYHGLPNPLTCPPDRSRKSIALYYFSNGRPASEVNTGLEDHTTLFKTRKGDTVDAEMAKFNKKQGAKEFIKDLTPPILFRAAKSKACDNEMQMGMTARRFCGTNCGVIIEVVTWSIAHFLCGRKGANDG